MPIRCEGADDVLAFRALRIILCPSLFRTWEVGLQADLLSVPILRPSDLELWMVFPDLSALPSIDTAFRDMM